MLPEILVVVFERNSRCFMDLVQDVEEDGESGSNDAFTDAPLEGGAPLAVSPGQLCL